MNIRRQWGMGTMCPAINTQITIKPTTLSGLMYIRAFKDNQIPKRFDRRRTLALGGGGGRGSKCDGAGNAYFQLLAGHYAMRSESWGSGREPRISFW